MPIIKITRKMSVLVVKGRHEYTCDCCGDEFYNILDKGSIRKTGLCCYCRDKRLLNLKCDCCNMTKNEN